MFSFQAQITEEAKENNVPPPDLAEMSKIGAAKWHSLDEFTRKVKLRCCIASSLTAGDVFFKAMSTRCE